MNSIRCHNIRVGVRTMMGLRGIAALTGLLLLGGLSGCEQASETNPIAEPEPVGGPPLVRRLTEAQYRATIADVFGPDIPIAARFERGLRSDGLLAIGTSEAGMSRFSVEQYDAAARSVATAVVSEERREEFVPCTPKSETAFDEPCATAFVERYAPVLLRRSLEPAEINEYVDVAQKAASQLENFYYGLKYALVGMLVSPEFLLRVERTEPDPEHPGVRRLDAYSKAARLSYFLTNSTPDRELLRAAEAGELNTEQGLARQVDRLMATPGFERALRAFFRDMLEFDLFNDLAKDPELYPAYNSDVKADAQEQTLRTIVHHLMEQEGDYRDLFTTRETFLTRALGIVYREPVPTRNGWEKVEFPKDSARAGIHSHISFLALHSHPGRSSPTLRGEAIRNVFLCQEVPDPPPDTDFSIVQDPSETNMPTARDRLHLHNTEPSCKGCHKIMDPIGLALENFDALGTFRTHEFGALIDPSGDLDGVEYESPDGLARALSEHPETPRCLVEKMYRFAVGRDTVWKERAYMDYLLEGFANEGYRVPELMRRIALSDNFFAITPPGDDSRLVRKTSTQTDDNGDRT